MVLIHPIARANPALAKECILIAEALAALTSSADNLVAICLNVVATTILARGDAQARLEEAELYLEERVGFLKAIGEKRGVPDE